ncbi:MAG: hypothetical protein ABJF23_34500, partial [Bryobacteraceae bacterium]
MLLAVSALLLFLTCWNIIPAPVLLLFPLAVAGPELSPWFMGAAVLLGILARRSRVALLLCALSFICSAIPTVALLATRHTRSGAFAAVVSQPEAAGPINSRPILTQSNIPYPVRGGTLHMTIYRPEGAGLYPAIVMIYGGAWRSGSPADNAEFARHMA